MASNNAKMHSPLYRGIAKTCQNYLHNNDDRIAYSLSSMSVIGSARYFSVPFDYNIFPVPIREDINRIRCGASCLKKQLSFGHYNFFQTHRASRFPNGKFRISQLGTRSISIYWKRIRVDKTSPANEWNGRRNNCNCWIRYAVYFVKVTIK